MSDTTWEAVDRYIEDLVVPPDPVLAKALENAAAAGLPHIQVTPSQGKLLSILAQSVQARSILEIGTLGAYSTIWLARALPPDGRLITLEADPHHARVARTNVDLANLDGRVEVRVGRALDSLPQLVSEGSGPFDLIFIDADKPNCLAYFNWALKLTRPGSLIITDNVVRGGAAANPNARDADVQGVRSFNAGMAAESRVSATILQTVSSKGHDGMAIALVLR